MIVAVLTASAGFAAAACAFCLTAGYLYGRQDDWETASGAFWAAMWLALISALLSLFSAQYLAAALGAFITLIAFFSTYDARNEMRKHDDQ